MFHIYYKLSCPWIKRYKSLLMLTVLLWRFIFLLLLTLPCTQAFKNYFRMFNLNCSSKKCKIVEKLPILNLNWDRRHLLRNQLINRNKHRISKNLTKAQAVNSSIFKNYKNKSKPELPKINKGNTLNGVSLISLITEFIFSFSKVFKI